MKIINGTTVLDGKDINQSKVVEEKVECHHICISNCRREGCNCQCGEYHKEN